MNLCITHNIYIYTFAFAQRAYAPGVKCTKLRLDFRLYGCICLAAHPSIFQKNGPTGTSLKVPGYTPNLDKLTPWKINMESTNHPFIKENDLKQTSMIMFHVNLQGWKEMTTFDQGQRQKPCGGWVEEIFAFPGFSQPLGPGGWILRRTLCIVCINLYGGFRKWWVSPQIIHFNRVFYYKPSILGYPYFLETSIYIPYCLHWSSYKINQM